MVHFSTNSAEEIEDIANEFETILTNETYSVISNLSLQTRPWLKWKCHETCAKQNGRSFCWGPGDNQCQIREFCSSSAILQISAILTCLCFHLQFESARQEFAVVLTDASKKEVWRSAVMRNVLVVAVGQEPTNAW